VTALCAEIRGFAPDGAEHAVDTVYLGGGTPSLLTPGQLDLILDSVSKSFRIGSDAELTMEMNPATMTLDTARAFRNSGINRASFGAQTFSDDELRRLGRRHSAGDVRATIELLRVASFANVSFDLIAGLPDQSLADWKRNLDEAIALGPDHLSLYLLEIHEGTPLAEQLRTNRRPLPDEELAGAMYGTMVETVGKAGYAQYEISNFARPGRESRHNSKYWRLDPVFGFGVSAHSFDGRERYANESDTARYVALIEGGASAEVYRETPDLASEYVFLGLRMNDGVGLEDYSARFDRDLLDVRSGAIENLRSLGLVDLAGGRFRLSDRGRLFSNEVFREFV
jgi:oxygen-independent coproporphyrinogen-3 oxidase